MRVIVYTLVILLFVGVILPDLGMAQQVQSLSYDEADETTTFDIILGVAAIVGIVYWISSSSKKRAEEEAKLAEEIKRYFENNPDRLRFRSAVEEGKAAIGMTAQEAEWAWGKPNDINRSVYTWGVHEQWVYRGANYRNSYLYFENGVLKSMQN